MVAFFEFWKRHGFTILVGSCILIALLLSLFNGKGTWTEFGSLQFTSTQTPEKKRERGDSKGELECRRVLETFFNQPFPKSRPNFLNNPVTGGAYNLELDCFNSDLNLAVEYNGVQHYKFTPYFHKNREAFDNQKYRDYMKRKMCEENNIILIEVPYTVKLESIDSYLKSQLRTLNRKLSQSVI